MFIITFLGGFFLHWLVPAMPLAASFALAAILAPTDPIAVQSLASRVHLPAGLMHLIAGESLINDASGLIGFKYGIAAVMTGTFIWTQAIGDFFYIAVVGALAGALLMGIINLVRLWLLQQGINDTILHAVLQLITPFLIYLLVDDVIGASGVIAVVVAGLLTNASGNRFISALPELRIVTEKTWDIVVYVLNGLIFILLGLELPVAMHATIESRAVSTWQALLDVVLVYLVMLAIRVGWTYGYMWVTAWHQQRRPTQRLPGAAERHCRRARGHFAGRGAGGAGASSFRGAISRAFADAIHRGRVHCFIDDRGHMGLAGDDQKSRAAAVAGLCR
ncbi:cation:proton antiporter [Lacticaseibacillus camelliae]|uniref:cation:proton antiporter n=1 Tax=Lacticaseibacillus camelliae TaxID=381742 RepID=UPI0021E8E6CF|nr:cation:proton antiporter [Lacticaseibacillus camelliae]